VTLQSGLLMSPSSSTKDKVIIDLCGGTGSWSLPYRAAGYHVIIVDPISIQENSIRQDVRKLAPESLPRAHGVLAAPPCTHFALSGQRWWREKGPRAELDAFSIVQACLRIIFAVQPQFWAMENPEGKLRLYMGKPDYTFHPYHFGDPWTKKTLLWGRFNLPKQRPVSSHIRLDRDWVSNAPRSSYGPIKKSITPPGFAQAFYEANK
jgi:hypothetical protein